MSSNKMGNKMGTKFCQHDKSFRLKSSIFIEVDVLLTRKLSVQKPKNDFSRSPKPPDSLSAKREVEIS